MADLRKLDFNLLKTFDVLIDELSVTRAAERLALTQPAVSGMLTRLRQSFDDPLFVRAQHGVVPTTRALELAQPIKAVLSDIEKLLQPVAFDPKSVQMPLTIAATDYALRAVVVPFLERLRSLAPGIRVAARALDHSKIQGQFERGEVDLALMTPESAPADLRARHLFDERYVCILREDHEMARETLSLDDFCSLDHALVSFEGGFSGITDTMLQELGRERRIAFSVPSFLVLLEALRVSDLVAVVPYRLVKEEPGLSLLEPPIPIPGFSKVLAWHERTHRDPVHQWVRNLLAELFEERQQATD
ncbi:MULTISPECIES: LysR family transcriptional regulator [Marinobacter]|uniref:LysR family transcriptional regulator n=1 Tax=Marinobacter TaxID=2742 RepID=UPI000DAEBE0A|nr:MULTISPECIES: LysR family transcriptional regulator [Marinobacter]